MSARSRRDRAKAWSLRVLILFGVLAVALASCAARTPRYEGPVSDNFDGSQFRNETPVVKTLGDLLRWRTTREPGDWEVRENDRTKTTLAENVNGSTIRATFVNHATVLIQTGGQNILTDPIWSERASPLSWAGPRRFKPPGIEFQDLPPINAVLVSHNHYDHMDLPTLRRLAEIHNPVFIVPLGNAAYLQRANISNIRELDWWQETAVGTVTVYAVPAQHWSRRGLFDTNRALWAGYYVTHREGAVFFAGDTGMNDHFGAVRDRLGAPDLALLPIGAYLPRWFMAPQHIDPFEAVAAHAELGARQTMAIHFGTFALGDDGQDQPVDDLTLALHDRAERTGTFWVPAQGESRDFTGRNRLPAPGQSARAAE